MPDKVCPKCKKISEDIAVCQYCGINFDEYEAAKQEKFIEIRVLLSENRFVEAKELAEKLPAEFPDNRVDFLLLLSNINRDISIVEKYELALREYEEGDYTQVTLILRNIKAFDGKLNEKVISLRRRAEVYLQSDARFMTAVKEFESGNYSKAYSLFCSIEKSTSQDKVEEYIHRIDDMKEDILENAVTSLRENKIDVAGEQFQIIESIFPEMKPEIQEYVEVLSRRLEIRNTLFTAARSAEKDKRLLDAKVLYTYAGMQFPELMPQIHPRLEQIGTQAIINLVDLQQSGTIDLESLGLEVDDDNPVGFASHGFEEEEGFLADIATPDMNESGAENLVKSGPVAASTPDTPIKQLVINKEEVADFAM